MVPPNIPNHFSIRQHTITLFRMFLHWVPGSGAWLDQTLGGQSACGLLWRVRGLTVFFALGVEFFRAWIPPIRGPAMIGAVFPSQTSLLPSWQGEATAKTKQLETIFSKCDGVAGATARVVSKSPTGVCKRFPVTHLWEPQMGHSYLKMF
jgi:hypothetical protein